MPNKICNHLYFVCCVKRCFLLCDHMKFNLLICIINANFVPYHLTLFLSSKQTLEGNMTVFFIFVFPLCSGISGCYSCYRTEYLWHRENFITYVRCFFVDDCDVWLNYRTCLAENVCFVKRTTKTFHNKSKRFFKWVFLSRKQKSIRKTLEISKKFLQHWKRSGTWFKNFKREKNVLQYFFIMGWLIYFKQIEPLKWL